MKCLKPIYTRANIHAESLPVQQQRGRERENACCLLHPFTGSQSKFHPKLSKGKGSLQKAPVTCPAQLGCQQLLKAAVTSLETPSNRGLA